ncbi:MAG: hypothetical protein KL840_08435 [Aquamicrobium sp.]|nr:hypothetical protein [Aquamicrobium sp.]
MRYQSGEEIKVGDFVVMPDGIDGKVVISIGADDYDVRSVTPGFGHLKPGILLITIDRSAVHYGLEYDMQAVISSGFM